MEFQTTGQPGRFTFTGTAGQGWSMQATAGSTFTSNIALSVYRPNGNLFTSTTLSGNSDVKVSFGLLPETGTYAVVVEPNGVDSGTVSMRLVAEATGTLTVDGGALSVVLGTAQNGRYTFASSSGALLNLVISSFATSPSGGSVTIYLYRPNGSHLWGTTVSSAPVTRQVTQLPDSGTYTLRVLPAGTRGATSSLQLAPR